jgi:hypothetical protein
MTLAHAPVFQLEEALRAALEQPEHEINAAIVKAEGEQHGTR